MYSLPTPTGRQGRATAVTGSPAAHSASTPRDQYCPTAFHPETSCAEAVVATVGVVVPPAVLGGAGTGGHDAMRAMSAPVLTDATYELGFVGSGRAVQGSRLATLILTSGGAPLTAAVKSNKQFHCSPPADMSSQRLAVMLPRPSSWLATASRTMTGAPTASPAVDPPWPSGHPTQVPSANRTASENGSVWANGGPAASTPPALPATAVPLSSAADCRRRRRRRARRRRRPCSIRCRGCCHPAGRRSRRAPSTPTLTSDVDGAAGRSTGRASRPLVQATSASAAPITRRASSHAFPFPSRRTRPVSQTGGRVCGRWRRPRPQKPR